MGSPDWLSFHLYYHEGLLRPIQELVQPVVIDLLRSGKIDRFFFVRYGLGGPHLRFRLRPQPGELEEVKARVEKQALEFLASTPSRSSLSYEAVESATRSIIQSDPYETDDTIYPDNWFQFVLFQPETDRYGGPELLDFSLDLFAVSSLEALAFLNRHAAESRSRQLPWLFRLLLRQAIGFASSPEELERLLRYAEISWAEKFPRIVEKANATFDKQRAIFISLFEEELHAFGASQELTPDRVLFEAARSLGRGTKELNPDRRWVIGGSQLHMTANRLIASNPEEVYLSRLLFLTWLHLQAAQPERVASICAGRDMDSPNGPEVTLRWMKLKLAELIRSV